MPSDCLKQLIFLLCLSFLLPGSGEAAFFGKSAAEQQKRQSPMMRKTAYRSVDTLSDHQPGKKKGAHKLDAVLVKFKASAADSSRNKIHQKHGNKRVRDFKRLNIHQVKLKKGLSVAAAIKLYQAAPEVEYVEPDYLVSAATTPDDPYYGSSGSWGQSFQDMWGLHKMQLGDAWELSQGSAQVVVAVSDTGLDLSHPDIQGNIWTNAGETAYNGIDDDANSFTDDLHGWNFITNSNDPADDHGHGTHVSGTIAARTNNATGVAGISWHAKIMPLKFLDSAGSGYVSDGIATIVYAADNGARVINCSWGSPSYSQSLDDAIDYAFQNGAVVVAAAGNDATDASSFYPAGCDNVLTVAATDSNDQIANFSNYGPAVEVAAPGVDILSLRSTGTDMYGDGSHLVGTGYYRASGTSMAAPHVSGLAALLFSQHPTWSANQVMAQIVGSADNVGNAGLGTGRVNAFSALGNTLLLTRLQYQGHTMTALGGSNDGVLRAGESYQITVAVKNLAAPSSATVTLTSTDPYVAVTSGSAAISGIPSWGSADNAASPFVISVSPGAPNLHLVDFAVTIVAGDGSTSSGSFQRRVNPYLAGWPVKSGEDSSSDPALADMDGDGIPEVIMYSDQIHVLKADGTSMPGWPREAPSDFFWTPGLSVGDLDGDGKPEIVGNSMNRIYAWKADGTAMPGFPVDLSSLTEVGAGFLNTALADLDADGRLEIVSNANWAGKVYAWRADGTVQPGWPVSVRPAAGAWINMLPAIGDMNGDGWLEVLVPTDDDNKVYAWHHDGTPVSGWPVSLPDPPAAIVIGDVRGNGQNKIFVGTASMQIHALNGDGSSMPGWPRFGAAPSLGDLDGDGEMEVVTDGMIDMWVYRNDGSVFPGWPQSKISNSLKAPQLGDIDGDGGIEVVGRTLWGMYAWHADGTSVAGFPIQIKSDDQGFADPSVALGDIKGDGRVYLVTGSGSGDGNIYAFDLAAPPAPLHLIWPMQQRDVQRTGGMLQSPVIVTSSFYGAPGAPFSGKLAARKGTAPYEWEIVSGSPPAGVTLSSSGDFSGVPLQAGSFTFTVRVRDAVGAISASVCTFLAQPVAIEAIELLPAQIGVWYSRSLTAAGSAPPYAWSVIDGILPPGLSLNAATGTLAGYPTAGGSFAFTVRLADANGQQTTKALQIDVSEPQPQIDPRGGTTEAITVDNQGNLYTVRQINGYPGYSLVKTDSSGELLWTRSFPGGIVRGVLVDDTGNVYLAGLNGSEPQTFAMKYDSSGNPLWTRYNNGALYGMDVDGAGNLYLAGAPEVRNGSDAWLIKYDTAGALLWNKQDITSDTPRGVAIDSAGDVYVSCALQTVIKFNPSGSVLWSRSYGSGYLLVAGIAADADNNIVVVSDRAMSKYAPSGTELWQVWLGENSPSALVTDSNNNIYLTGVIMNDSNMDMLTARYDASGNLVWAKTFDGGLDDLGFAIAVDESSHAVYAAGMTHAYGFNPVTVRYPQPKVTAALPEATLDGPFSHRLAAERGKTPYTFSTMSGMLPPGLSLDPSTGLISGNPTAAGSYSFTVKVTDANGIADAASISLAVNSSTPATDFVASPLLGQAPLLVDFADASNNSPGAWSWLFGDGSSSSAQNKAHAYTMPGTYTVSLTTTNDAGSETRTRTDYITVLACSNAPVNLASLGFSSFTDLQSAYAQAMDNDLILLQALDFGTGLNLDRNIRVTLKGGYDCGFLDNRGAAVLGGDLRVQDGTVKVERLILR